MSFPHSPGAIDDALRDTNSGSRSVTTLVTSLKRLAILSIFIAGCRTVSPVKDIQPASEPNISRVMLKNGNVVIFDQAFGWFNKQAGTVEGETTDSQHVEYHLSELSKVETVRAYSILPAILAGGIILGVGIYVLSRLLALV